MGKNAMIMNVTSRCWVRNHETGGLRLGWRRINVWLNKEGLYVVRATSEEYRFDNMADALAHASAIIEEAMQDVPPFGPTE